MIFLLTCCCFSFLIGSYCENKWGRSTERLSRIKSLMRKQNERLLARDSSHQPLKYENLWVDVWVEVAPYEER